MKVKSHCICLLVVSFLNCFGKVATFDILKDGFSNIFKDKMAEI